MCGFLVIKIILVAKEGFWFQPMKNSGRGSFCLPSCNIPLGVASQDQVVSHVFCLFDSSTLDTNLWIQGTDTTMK